MHYQDIIKAIEAIDPVVQDSSEMLKLISQIEALNGSISATELKPLLEASIMTCHNDLVQAVITQYLRMNESIPDQTDTVMMAWETMKAGGSRGSVECYMADTPNEDPDPRIRALNMIQILLDHKAITISQDFVSSELNPLLEREPLKYSIQPALIGKINEVKGKIDHVEKTPSQPASRSPSPPAALSVAPPVAPPVECRPSGVTTSTESSSGGASSQWHPG